MSQNKSLTINFKEYSKAIQAVGELSRLYSDSETPLIHPRFIERLYVANTKSQDLSRSDISFDAKHQENFGVGIKTFIATPGAKSKLEKVAEFTREGGTQAFKGMKPKELALRVSELRNKRILADAIQVGISLENSIYHCLVRFPGSCIVIEEPYRLIDIENIKPTDKFGTVIESWDSDLADRYFTDGISTYTFSISKSVLLKRFNLTQTTDNLLSQTITVKILDNPLNSILEQELSQNIFGIKGENVVESVVLPLYGTKLKANKKVEERSGINQWNARGRTRSFGEAYIPIPVSVRSKYPKFFPPRDVPFNLELPNGKIVEVKVCQDDGKALMSRKNSDLVEWLYEIIDGSLDDAKKRIQESRPYKYSDLLEIGRDSVIIEKLNENFFRISLSKIGTFEEFLAIS